MFGEPRNPVEKEICELQKTQVELVSKMKELYKNLPEEQLHDYELKTLDGHGIFLSELFADHDEMLLIHNMGPQCPYCTLWADGFRSMKPYYESRCAFVLETDIAPSELKEFAATRKWDFKTVSSAETNLKSDLGFKTDRGNLPGVSSLFKKDGKIFRHGTSPFGPGDSFCPPWHFFDLLKYSEKEWHPNYNL